MSRRARLLFVALAAGALAGCQTIGPGTVRRDRIDYVGAIGDSWKQQTLLNITRLRYADTPVFLDISSVISSYTLQGEIGIEGTLFSGSRTPNETVPSVRGTYIDRPTISYAPLTGQRFINAVLRPLPPSAIFAMIQAGSPADYVLQATVRAINDLHSHTIYGTRTRPEDPDFYHVIGALRRLQLTGALGSRVDRLRNEEAIFISFREGVDEASDRDIAFLRRALRADPARKELRIVYGSPAAERGEIGFLTRSIMQILVELSAGVEVPERHIAQGRARPSLPPSAHAGTGEVPLVRVRSGAEAPAEAYVSVRYRDHWFWIDDGDMASKRVFTFLMVFSSIAETGAAQQAPVLTIPAN